MAAKKAAKAKKATRKPAKRTASVTNMERLERAGVVRSAHCTEAHRKAINKLSSAEVGALIKVRKKLSKHLEDAPAGLTEGAGRPWIL